MALIATFQMLKPKEYDQYKGQMKSYIRGSVPGIGDDAFDGPPGNYPYVLCFKKGDWVVSLSTFFDTKSGKQMFMEQLSALAKAVIGRLQAPETATLLASGSAYGLSTLIRSS
jgi:hypothetical protein